MDTTMKGVCEKCAHTSLTQDETGNQYLCDRCSAPHMLILELMDDGSTKPDFMFLPAGLNVTVANP